MPVPVSSSVSDHVTFDIFLPFLRDHDARPTFIFRSIDGQPQVTFANKSLHRLQSTSPPGTDIIQTCHSFFTSSSLSRSFTNGSSGDIKPVSVPILPNRVAKAYPTYHDSAGNPGWICVIEEEPVPTNVRNGEVNLRDSEPEFSKPIIVRSNTVGTARRALRTPLLANVGNEKVIDGMRKVLPVKLQYQESKPALEKVVTVVSKIIGNDATDIDPKIMARDGTKPLPVLDWTKGYNGISEEDTEHFAFLRSIEWEKTGLGHYSTWSDSLRTITNAIMAMPNPAALYITETGLSIYNEKWKHIAQERHPWLMGAPFVQGWPEAVVYFKPLLRAVMEGKCIYEENSLFFLQRVLPQEEAYISFSLTPVTGPDGKFLAVLTMAFENTNNVVRKRRVRVIQTLSEKMAIVKDLDSTGDFWSGILESLDENPHDSPFVALYRVTDEGKTLEFVDGRGLPESRAEVEKVFDRRYRLDGRQVNGNIPQETVFGKYLRRVNEDQQAFYQVDFTTDDMIQLSKMQYRGFNECDSCVILRIHMHHGTLEAVLVLGVNNRSPLNSPYKRWIANICHTLTATVGKARLLQEEVNRRLEDKIAGTAAGTLPAVPATSETDFTDSLSIIALERAKAAEVKEKLIKRTQMLRESELLFTKTAASIPVGLVCQDAQGSIIYANDAWHSLCGLKLGEPMDNWPSMIYNKDREKVLSAIREAIANKSPMEIELRIGNDPTPGSKGWLKWCRKSIDPNIDQSTGEITGYFGTLVDITSIKDAEEFQRQITIDALERKRQQDNFIDVTSHELRNPLSAILQSADELVRTLEEFSAIQPPLPKESLQNALEAADTILACGEHQRKIIDDILNVSKLDAGLLTVCPVPIRPHVVLERTMRIFHPELKSKGITSDFKLTEAYHKLCYERFWKLDPARLTQILINLVTNAIKFTSRKAGRKEINVTVDASRKRPAIRNNFTNLTADDCSAPPSGSLNSGPIQSPAVCKCPDGQAVYLHVHVQDTGIGISKEWQKILGQRFQQAPKTHVNYGGSGLGIFIARKLAYLLGGELHFESEEGEGSTFSFFVRCCWTSPPTEADNTDYDPGVVRNVAVPPRPQMPARRTTEELQMACEENPANNNEENCKPCRRRSSLSTPDATGRKKRDAGYDIVIVEDNKLNQTILRRQLDNIGCHTSVANNGLECLEILKKKPGFTVVLMDMEMPVMDGIDATQRIRANENEGGAGEHVTIIGTSANARSQQIDEMLGAGMDAVITKPFLIGDLMTKIENVLEQRKKAENGDLDACTSCC